jgi:hypothetical protein
MIVVLLFVFTNDAVKTGASNSIDAAIQSRDKELKEFCDEKLESEIRKRPNDYVDEINETVKNISAYTSANFIPMRKLKPRSEVKKKEENAYYKMIDTIVGIALINRACIPQMGTIIPEVPSPGYFCVPFDEKFCLDFYRWYQKRLSEIGVKRTLMMDGQYYDIVWDAPLLQPGTLPLVQYQERVVKNKELHAKEMEEQSRRREERMNKLESNQESAR